MSSPIAHALAAAGITLLGIPAPRLRGPGRRDLVAGLVLASTLAIAPDLDFAPVALLGWDQRLVHRTYSHSLLAAVLAAVLAGPFLGRRLRVSRMRGALLAGLVYASHLGIDLLCYDELPPAGVNLLWPFSPWFTPPLPILPSLNPVALVRLDLLPTLLVVLDEVLVVGGAVAVALIARRIREVRRARQAPEARA